MWKRRAVFVLSILFSFISSAQQEKEDEYLKDLAKKIQFEYKESYFKEGSLEAMKDLVEHINSNGKNYLIISHTSVDGDIDNNQKLTDRRAILIKKLMVKLGVDSLRVKTIGFGQNYPCCLTPTRSGRYLNNRIAIQVTSKEEIKELKSSKE
ncbi:OmpA family protein [Tenacibaculum sp. 190524A05c]|uniref:OmpA family protein n=1 Tax=Tenacibaculum platacis TaxID=3137852 RepID=UPI0032B30DA9